MTRAVNMDRVRQLLAYDPIAGAFTWLRNGKGRNMRLGSPAGYRRGDGYVRITVDGKSDYAHRWAWRLAVGPLPDDMEVDHIDHNPSNNRLDNLRLVTRSGNKKNRSRDSRNTSGVNGVFWSKNANAWCAQVRSNRHTKHVGYFKDLADAAAARKQAEQGLGFHINHGAMQT